MLRLWLLPIYIKIRNIKYKIRINGINYTIWKLKYYHNMRMRFEMCLRYLYCWEGVNNNKCYRN